MSNGVKEVDINFSGLPKTFTQDSEITFSVNTWTENPYKTVCADEVTKSKMTSISFYDSNGIIEVKDLNNPI